MPEIADTVRTLIGNLGLTLTATLAGAKNRKDVLRWTHVINPDLPERGQQIRISAAFVAWGAIARREGEHTARAWFIGNNPYLREQPVIALRKGQWQDVVSAAISFSYPS